MGQLLKMRAAPAYLNLANPRIDRKHNMLHDVVAMLAGVEALGHGLESDQTTIEVMATLGNQRRNGIQQRFGHPGMSENAMGKKLGFARNFRVVGDKLLHSTTFMQPASLSPVFTRDPIEYIFQMAEHHPAEIAESVVIEADAVWKLSDGREVSIYERDKWKDDVRCDDKGRPIDATNRLPVIRPATFYYVDVVSEGALTHDGLFGAKVLEEMFSGTTAAEMEEAFRLMDRARETYGIALQDLPTKAEQVISRYLASRGREVMAGTRRNKPLAADTTGSGIGANGLLAASEAAETPPKDPPPEQDDGGENADPLDAAEAATDEVASDLDTQDDGAPSSEEPVSAEVHQAALDQIAELQQRVDDMGTQFAAMSERVERMAKLVQVNAENIKRVHRNTQRLAGDPVETVKVPNAPPTTYEGMVQNPPPVSLSAQTGGGRRASVQQTPVGRTRNSDAEDAARASLSASTRRNRPASTTSN